MKPIQIKNAAESFAAGPEVCRAFSLLSDGAFCLYFYLCVKASRTTGTHSATYRELAAELQKSKNSIIAYIQELRAQGVCLVRPAVNQHERTHIEICDRYWPYKKQPARSA